MSYLKRTSSGAVTEDLDRDSKEYQTLTALRNTAGTSPLFEDVPEAVAEAATVHILAISEPGATIAADEVVAGPTPQYSGTITLAEFVAGTTITGADTNSRTVTTQQTAIAGTATPTRTVTTLTTLALTNTVNAAAGVPKAMTINSAGFLDGEPIEVKSAHVGTGIVDPGGLVLLTYTRT